VEVLPTGVLALINSGQLAFGAGPSDATYSTSEAVNTNTWTNVASTRNKATGEIKLYINGVLKRTGTGYAGNSLNCSADGRTWIGNGQDAPAYSFGGNIGSVLAYTNILSASDILTNYEATSGTFYPPTYTMTYNANGATSGSVPANGSYESGSAPTTVSTNSGTLARTGYSFSGWNSSADGTGTTYAAGSGTYSSNANVTLYAKWAPNSLDVTFNSQSGTLVAGTTVQVGATLAAPVAPTRNGYTFTGWSTTSSGSVVSFPYTHARTADFTLYAIWTLTPTTTTSPPVVVIDIQVPVNTVAQGQESVATVAPTVSTVAPSAVVVATTTTIANVNSAEAKNTPTTSVAPIAAPTNSVVAPVIPRLSTGESALDVGGVKTKVDMTRENNQLVISSGSLRAVLSGLDDKGATRALDADGNWKMRVVPNRYPAFEGDDSLAVRNLGPVHVMAEASGTHEVFVFSPDHNVRLDMFSDEVIAELMTALRSRFKAHADTPNIRYTQAIVNHGREAGASLAHPHGQLLGLPFVAGRNLGRRARVRAFQRWLHRVHHCRS